MTTIKFRRAYKVGLSQPNPEAHFVNTTSLSIFIAILNKFSSSLPPGCETLRSVSVLGFVGSTFSVLLSILGEVTCEYNLVFLLLVSTPVIECLLCAVFVDGSK